MEEWRNMSQVFIGNGRASLPERLDDSGNLERVPYQDGVASRWTKTNAKQIGVTSLKGK
jgi:hypothetical protein